MKKIFLFIFLILILSGCNSNLTTVNEIEPSPNEKDVNQPTNEEINTEYTYNDFNEYFAVGIINPTQDNITAYIEDIQNYFNEPIATRIRYNRGLNYIVFELSGTENNAIGIWEIGNKFGEILLNDSNSSIDDIIKERYLVVNRGDGPLKTKEIYDLKLFNVNEKINSEIKVHNNFYDINNTDWIVYEFPTTNEIKPQKEAMDIKFYNLKTKEEIIYKEAKDNFGWALELDKHNRLEILRVEWDEESIEKRTFFQWQDLDNWVGEFKPSQVIYAYGDIEPYLSEEIANPTDENIKNYIMQLPEYVDNSVVEIMDEYENDKYIVFQISEILVSGVDSNIVCVWEKGNSNGGFILDKWNTEIDGMIEDKYLIIDSGSWTIRSKTVHNMSLDKSDENFYDSFSVLNGIYSFEGTNWIIYSTPTENRVENMPIDELCDIELYNLSTNERIILKEANNNYAWFLENEPSDDGLLDIIKIESNEEHKLTSTVMGKIDLNNWSALANELGIE